MKNKKIAPVFLISCCILLLGLTLYNVASARNSEKAIVEFRVINSDPEDVSYAMEGKSVGGYSLMKFEPMYRSSGDQSFLVSDIALLKIPMDGRGNEIYARQGLLVLNDERSIVWYVNIIFNRLYSRKIKSILTSRGSRSSEEKIAFIINDKLVEVTTRESIGKMHTGDDGRIRWFICTEIGARENAESLFKKYNLELDFFEISPQRHRALLKGS